MSHLSEGNNLQHHLSLPDLTQPHRSPSMSDARQQPRTPMPTTTITGDEAEQQRCHRRSLAAPVKQPYLLSPSSPPDDLKLKTVDPP